MLKVGNKILAKKVKICNTDYLKLRGLMFRFSKFKDEALVFVLDKESRANASIHMFFVFFPIDVLFVNSKREIVDFKKKILPFTPLVIPKFPAKYIIELPKGTLKDIKVKQKVSW